MNIYGVGTDIVEVKRINKLIKKKTLLKKIFNTKEITKCLKIKNSSNCFAKRFAAKEAFSKALGTGFTKGVSFNEIIILNEKNGKPYIKLLDRTKTIVKKRIIKKNYKISLSLSDEKNYAVAFVTISI